MTYRTHCSDHVIGHEPTPCQKPAQLNGAHPPAVPPNVITLVEEPLRGSLSAATTTYCTMVHAGSIAEAIATACEKRAHTVLLSPLALANEPPPMIAKLLANCPGACPVAVIGERQRGLAQEVLALGSIGVRHVVDLSSRDGWNRLRDLVARACDPATTQILEAVMPMVAQSSTRARDFIEALVRNAPRISTIQAFARTLGLSSSTLMSRFYRAGLPSPRHYLAAMRLLYATWYFEDSSASIAIVAYRLRYSSPQSFGRHVQALMRMTAREFRYRYSATHMTSHFEKTLIAPHLDKLRTFDPLGFQAAGATTVRSDAV